MESVIEELPGSATSSAERANDITAESNDSTESIHPTELTKSTESINPTESTETKESTLSVPSLSDALMELDQAKEELVSSLGDPKKSLDALDRVNAALEEVNEAVIETVVGEVLENEEFHVGSKSCSSTCECACHEVAEEDNEKEEEEEEEEDNSPSYKGYPVNGRVSSEFPMSITFLAVLVLLLRFIQGMITLFGSRLNCPCFPMNK